MTRTVSCSCCTRLINPSRVVAPLMASAVTLWSLARASAPKSILSVASTVLSMSLSQSSGTRLDARCPLLLKAPTSSVTLTLQLQPTASTGNTSTVDSNTIRTRSLKISSRRLAPRKVSESSISTVVASAQTSLSPTLAARLETLRVRPYL